jgi:hypothetical protein
MGWGKPIAANFKAQPFSKGGRVLPAKVLTLVVQVLLYVIGNDTQIILLGQKDRLTIT